MKQVDFLIVGGSAAGTTAAEVIRTLYPNSSITITTDEDHEQYSRVLLPHYIRGKVSREQVFLKKTDWYTDKKIELLKGVKTRALESGNHLVGLDNGESIKYGKLLIAIGGYVIKLDVPGADLSNILYMRTIEDADKIIKLAKKSKSAVIVGGGFIGLEFASCFRVNGVGEVTMLVMEPYYWQGKLDEASSRVLAATLERNGVKILINEEVDRFESDAVITKSGKRFAVDVVGVGIGIRSDLSWLEGSGIKINRGIVTNEYLETSLPNVYAAGDCAEFWDVIFERQHIMGNWANATSQGNVVGRTMAVTPPRSAGQSFEGQGRTVFETASSYSINFFDGLPSVASAKGGSCTFIGVTDEKFADEAVSRGSVESGKMTRIFVKTMDGKMRIVGATVINDPAQVSPLTSAVKNKVDIAKYKDKLGDEKFDLRELVET